MKTAPQLLKGFRDFLPEEKKTRDLVMGRIVATFARNGFEPIETPTLEYKETIMGKYGDEADKLVYAFEDNGGRAVALRYDQTVPTARFIAANANTLPMPFRRYQTQNVFRADKPQRGRYREFTQCDIDIFGSTDPLADAEILATTYAAYKAIGFPGVTLLVNDRESLIDRLSPFTIPGVSVFSIIQTIDKLDKLPPDEVIAELVRKGLANPEAAAVLRSLEQAAVSPALAEIIQLTQALGVPASQLVYTPGLARGLDYYTGMIFEVRIDGYTVGSVGGGGRYDNLLEQLCGLPMPAVGMAFGFDRTVEAAQQLGVLSQAEAAVRVLVAVFEPQYAADSAKAAAYLREQGVATELYPRYDKLGKQLKYADKKQCAYALVLGSTEIENHVVVLKNLRTGQQQTVTLPEVPHLI